MQMKILYYFLEVLKLYLMQRGLKVPVEVFDKQFTDLIPTTKPTVNEEVAEKYFYYIIVRLNIIPVKNYEKVRKEIKRLNIKI